MSLKNQGFSLIELLVAMSISVMVVLMVSLVFTQGVKHTRVIDGESKLLESAAHMTDILSFNIRQAVSISLPTSNQLEIVNPDLTTSTFKYTGSELQLDDNSILQPQINLNRIAFIIIDKTIQISYELSIDTGSNPDFYVYPFAATTTIAIRN